MQEVVPINVNTGNAVNTGNVVNSVNTGDTVNVLDHLSSDEPSVRLKAALAVGSRPDAGSLETLVERCAVEPDFYVRDMLSWALTRLPVDAVLPRVRRELDSGRAQARSQALHTLSKIGDGRAWEWITRDLLRDADDEVARTAWRVAVVLAPDAERPGLAAELARQLGRGDRDVRLSLSRAFTDLGDVSGPVLERAAASPDQAVAEHARVTELLRQNPELGFDAAVHDAKRIAALGPDGADRADGADPADGTDDADPAHGPAGTESAAC